MSFKGIIWIRWWYGGDKDNLVPNIDKIEGRIFSRLGNEELMNLLEDILLERISEDDS